MPVGTHGTVKGVMPRDLQDEVDAAAVVLGEDGKALGVRVLKHTETPGLGDKIEVSKGDWVKSFDGKSLGNPAPEQWGVKKDNGIFDQFAGATITPRAVVKAVKGGMDFFTAHKAEITG